MGPALFGGGGSEEILDARLPCVEADGDVVYGPDGELGPYAEEAWLCGGPEYTCGDCMLGGGDCILGSGDCILAGGTGENAV